MADCYEEGRETTEISKLLCSDQKDAVLSPDPLTPRPDHCDRLLDAIDQQLDQLQIMSPKPKSNAVPTSKNGKNESMLTFWDVSVNNKECRRSLDVILRGKEETEVCRDQVVWRLQRLLGETLPLSERICSEECGRSFKGETTDLSPFRNMDQLDRENKAERTEMSDSDTPENDQNWQCPEKRRLETSDMVMPRGLQSDKSDPEREDGAFLSDSCGENMSHRNEKAGARERNKTPQRPADSSSGAATWSFDLDVGQQVRWTGRRSRRKHKGQKKHAGCKTLNKGCCSFMEDVGDLSDICVDHGDGESAGEEERETQFTAARRFTDGHEQMKSLSASSNSQQNNRKTNSENKDSSEDIKNLIRTSSPVRTSERQLLDFIDMKEEVFDRRRRCENEEKKLRSKRIQLKEVELCLSDLRQKKKETVRQLEQLSADTTWMQKEKRSLEFVLRNSRYQLQQLQRQTESHMKTVFCWKKQLEELHEELHGATEAGSSLLNRCACQQKQLEKRHQTEEPPYIQVSELQHLLGECRTKVGTLGEMLAQKELQLMGLQEERDSLHAERDGLMRELQLYRELEGAQERRQLPINAAQRKQQTPARLAGSFTEQLTADLERCETTLMRCRNASKMKETSPDRSTVSGAKESQEAVCSPLHHAVVCAAAHVPQTSLCFSFFAPCRAQ
ncbi:trichohyalin-like [Poeciliopsis prolifica]|uniref:trichohyalin-like n=1 Tax=Poeciliopsis prolifica TaxID=188132 RepID=UPI0024135221|nr:trichohyalin-like [Poeciliopsis prolifica]